MMRYAGVSITITSFTSLFSFAISSTTSLPALSNFCAFAALGIFFDYFNQITFFVACIILDEKRMYRECGDCCGLCLCSASGAMCCRGKCFADEEGVEKEDWSRKFMREKYAPFLMKLPVKIIICVGFAVLVSVMAWGTSLLPLDMSREWFIKADDPVVDTIDIRDDYFGSGGSPVKIYTVDTDFSKESTQKDLIKMTEKLEDCSGCDESWIEDGSVSSWYEELNNWVGTGSCIDGGDVVALDDGVIPQEHFNYCARTWYDLPENNRYSSNIAWDGDEIEGASISATIKEMDDARESVAVMEDTRAITDDYGPGDSFPYSGSYLFWEGYAVFDKETALSLGLACMMVFIVLVLMMGDFITSGIVLLMVGSTDVCILGMLYFWGEDLNAVSIANIVIAVGLSVDYNAHIAHAFKGATGTREERVIKSLDTIGVSVIHGAFSTFLAVCVLALSQSYIFVLFFKAFFGIVLFGTLHGILLLPVILSWIGVPSTYMEPTKEESVEMEDQAEA